MFAKRRVKSFKAHLSTEAAVLATGRGEATHLAVLPLQVSSTTTNFTNIRYCIFFFGRFRRGVSSLVKSSRGMHMKRANSILH